MHSHHPVKENKQIPRKQHNLATLVAEKVTDNMFFTFDFSGYHYHSISEKLKKIIEEECIDILTSFSLSETQSNILKDNLKELTYKVAGTMTRNPDSINIVSGEGLTATGLTKIYFDALSCKIKTFVNDAINPFNPKIAHLWYEDIHGKHYDTSTYDKLNGDKEVRRKAILSILGEQLLLLSTPDQARALCNEIKEENNAFILALRKPRGLNSLLNREANTNSFVSYENQLFNLNCSIGLLVKLIQKSFIKITLPVDIIHLTTSFFTPKERNQLANTLPLVNKKMAKAKEKELNTLRETYKRS
ncbi:MAG: hypothetical protein KIT56_02975 [Gammaproteobacteria bacterium]|nr:hypothetical protein [Gammaproteobacteria bacterium]MCW5582839.1 hypothetical protein [Gammaproteobacteria bacterium]